MFKTLIKLIEKRRQKKWEKWNEILAHIDAGYKTKLGQIIYIRQKARTDTKAYIR